MIKQFTELEVKNQNYLAERSVSFEMICLTANILKHSIFDAKMSMRAFLKDNSVHDFYSQPKGQQSKRMVKTHVLTFMRDISTETSLKVCISLFYFCFFVLRHRLYGQKA